MKHGINIPLASIHTEKSSGIGEYLDLIPLIDWCHEIGLHIIQLLPLNDSGHDPSPYNALSMYALHPIYLRLENGPVFTKTKHVDYQNVLEKKLAHLYQNFVSEDLTEFIASHPWVVDYAHFKVLKEKHGDISWQDWPDEEIEDTKRVDFYIYLQKLCIEELTYVKEYAEKKGIQLKGDIPILVSPDSVEVWKNQHLFDMHVAAGAPPDVFNPDGQYWGFPIYNWEAIKRDNFSIWKKRLELATHFYHIYRIDHIIGFFRIWIIPRGHAAKDGYFEPKQKEAMIKQGRELLSKLKSFSPMIPIGENLGVIPPEVNHVLEELEICGTKVFRWERDYKGDRHYIPSSEFPPLNMTSVSTHDSETLELWWEHYPNEAKAYCKFKGWTYEPTLSYQRRLEILRESHHNPTIYHINLLQEYLALVPELTWEDPNDERINIPGHVLPTNWTYRYKCSIEEITSNEPFKQVMHKILND